VEVIVDENIRMQNLTRASTKGFFPGRAAHLCGRFTGPAMSSALSAGR
jgi:hypothetical protein